ncbi:cytochrome P450 4C1-like isoform X1 [Leptopilina heterotoma]|uniref:cytochrome P450 4C1-like isoform X1 n=2 Tax=Leptopilina heterotoma TaxID=63436 RepID=UPI001CA93820|nr:cytochrome P450 4C1-like isoform X1 [Leptopilina heterotoma]
MFLEILLGFSDIFILIVTSFFIIYLFQTKWIRLVKLAVTLPGPFAYPLIGNAFNFACKPEELLERAVKIVKPYVNLTPIRLWLGPMLCVIITKPRDLEIILNSPKANKKGFSYQFLKPFIGEGLISGSGPIWKSHRKIVAHILTQKVLDEFSSVFDRHSKILMRELKSLADGKEIDILGPIELCTANIVCETIMGRDDIDSLVDSNKEFLHYSAEMYRVVHDRVMKVWLYPDWIFKLTENYKIHSKGREVLGNFVKQCIKIVKKRRLRGENRNSILDRILNILETSDNGMTDEELKDEMITIYLAAQDTLAVISSFAILMLGIHPEIQEKARNEVTKILQKNNSIDGDKLSQLKIVDKIIKETLRLFPIAPLMARTAMDEIKLDSCTIPESCQIILVPFLTQRNAEYFSEPEIFNPERFDPVQAAERHSYSFIPFSAGPMGCIGQRYAMMSLKTIISNFLLFYKISSQCKMEEIKLKTDISIRSKNGYRVSLKPI